jgi:hypothetical protein
MDHTDNTLTAAIKALEDVVAPAVDPSDPLAGEQLALVVHALRVVRGRLDHVHDRARFDMRHALALAGTVADDAAACSPAAAQALEHAVDAATSLSESPDARTAELRGAAAEIAAALRVLVRESASADEVTRRRIERRIVEGTRERIKAERAWHLPQGIDPDPGSVVGPLEAALGRREAP